MEDDPWPLPLGMSVEDLAVVELVYLGIDGFDSSEEKAMLVLPGLSCATQHVLLQLVGGPILPSVSEV